MVNYFTLILAIFWAISSTNLESSVNVSQLYYRQNLLKLSRCLILEMKTISMYFVTCANGKPLLKNKAEKVFSPTKETKGRSSGQTPFTLKPKQLALKKTIFNPPKILPKFF